MSYVPRREKNRQAFSTSKGRALVEKMHMRSTVEDHLKSMGMTGDDATFGRHLGPASRKKQEPTTAVRKVTPLYDQEKDK